MKYIDYVDLSYEPLETDLVCEFKVKPKGIDIKTAAGGVAAESSIGTWTELTTTAKYLEKLHATVFELKDAQFKVAYPIELFEPANMPNILSSIAGNVFGLGALSTLRLSKVHFPSKILRNYRGPRFGISGIRKLLGVPTRPLVGTIIKPKLGLKTRDHAKVAYNAWSGGCDVVKDDENLSNQRFNPFEKRIIKTLDQRDKAREETGERKVYLANITAETYEMIRRAQFVKDHGGDYIMIDIITCGFAAVQTLRNYNFDLVIHAHRAGHAAFTKDPNHGIAMPVIASVSRLLGVDQLHVGTAVGKMAETKQEVKENIETLTEPLGKLKPVLPVASGGLHPGHIPDLVDIFGFDVVIQAGGGIHGHPKGSFSGAMAMRQALEAALNKIPLKDHAKDHTELKTALKTFK